MATRPRGFGMTAELARKREKNFDPSVANDTFDWMRSVLEDGGFSDDATSLGLITNPSDVIPPLKNGVLLCNLVNTVKPGSVKRINANKTAFKQMENINNFLTACENMGCKKIDLFQTVDLFEGTNPNQVINGIVALGRRAQLHYDGPVLGPTEASENKREFSEEQLRAGEGIIGLQAGSNKGASQAGQNFGKTRAIID